MAILNFVDKTNVVKLKKVFLLPPFQVKLLLLNFSVDFRIRRKVFGLFPQQPRPFVFDFSPSFAPIFDYFYLFDRFVEAFIRVFEVVILNDILENDALHCQNLLRVDQVHVKVFFEVYVIVTLSQTPAVLTSHKLVCYLLVYLVLF